ncbi:Type III pantothenate kinase [bioreactor metagenome]|uniref:Type III pantothenate kinase n=1 Tax=bioreactor metagenome TaxID=1076179 RepID=A0A645J2N9_9ZZZZ
MSLNGEFLTGITAPGIQVCADALFSSAAQIPKVEIKNPGSIIVKNTINSLQAGILFGHVGETVYIIDKIKKAMPERSFKVVATGGLARILDEAEDMFDVLDPVLTLKGLMIIFNKNKRNQKKDAYYENR